MSSELRPKWGGGRRRGKGRKLTKTHRFNLCITLHLSPPEGMVNVKHKEWGGRREKEREGDSNAYTFAMHPFFYPCISYFSRHTLVLICHKGKSQKRKRGERKGKGKREKKRGGELSLVKQIKD